MDLEGHLLETLRDRGGEQGLTHAELKEKCGVAWRRELARRNGSPEGEAAVAEVKDFVYQLWEAGRVVIEPPVGQGQAVRIWHPAEGGQRFGEAVSSEGGGTNGERLNGDQEVAGRVMAGYQELSEEHRSPYVFLSQLAEKTRLPLETLHVFLREEQEAGGAVLSTGDWAAASEAEREAMLSFGGRKYIKVRLVR